MSADFIKVARDQSAATEAAEFLQWLRDLRSVYERGIRIRAKQRHNFDDGVSPVNWVPLETLWGIPTGMGVTVWTLVDGTVGSLEGAFQVDAGKVITESVG